MKKVFGLLAATVLSVTVLGGCNTKNDVNNNDRIVPQRIDDRNNLDRNRMNNNNINDRNLNNRNNLDRNRPYDDTDLNNNYYTPAEDKNTDTDKDLIKDNNTKKEDIIEDDIDVKDRDRKDE